MADRNKGLSKEGRVTATLAPTLSLHHIWVAQTLDGRWMAFFPLQNGCPIAISVSKKLWELKLKIWAALKLLD
jgi:hypothetical protein